MTIRTTKTNILSIILVFFMTCSSSQRGLIILCAGDSFTESSYPRHLLKILASAGIRAKILNYGRSGYTSGEYLGYLQKYESTLATEHPDFIFIQLGTNDVRTDNDRTSKNQFYANLYDILDIFRQFQNPDGKKSRIYLATIPPIPDGTAVPFTVDSQARVVNDINPVILRIGKEEKIPVVDNYKLFQDNPHLLPDVHPNEEGYRRLAQNWFEAIRPLLK